MPILRDSASLWVPLLDAVAVKTCGYPAAGSQRVILCCSAFEAAPIISVCDLRTESALASLWEQRRGGWEKKEGDARNNWEIDYGRIIHSASFRRLQGKTQILNLGDSDFYRTRLTHSLEVAQVAASVTRQVAFDNKGHEALPHFPDPALIQAIGSTHDLGHPPFGHGGEVALNYCMRHEAGGFEGNGQTLRILSRLEKFSKNHGSELARRTLLGTLKYPVAYSDVVGPTPRLREGPTLVSLIDRETSKPPKCYMDSEKEIVQWILEPLCHNDRELFTSFDPPIRDSDKKKHGKPRHKSLDCSIMDVADDISYGVHDLEDVIALSLVDRVHFEKHVNPSRCDHYLTHLKETYKDEYQNDVYSKLLDQLFADGRERKHAISRLIGYFVHNCGLEEKLEFEEPLLRFRVVMRPDARSFVEALKGLVFKEVIKNPAVQHLEFKGQQMVVAVFETFASDPEVFLPEETRLAYEASERSLRVICDHVAGMTDTFLLKTYERLFSPRMGSVFDKL